MLKKIITLSLLILEIILVATAHIINYFTHKKMGMARHVVYMNQKWLVVKNFEAYKTISLFLVFISVFVIIYFLIKGIKRYSNIAKIHTGIFIVFSFYFLYFSIFNSLKSLRAFYLMYYIYCIALICMFINALINMSGKNQK